ncbi:hypothetical protein BDW62DRAFT_159763 [Aspergillus aurantiobrunneus]
MTTYDTTIPVAQAILTTLTHILHKAEQTHPAPSTLLTSRLHPTMYPLADQVRCLTQFTTFLAARLTNHEATHLGGNPDTFAECHARIEAVQRILAEADRDVVNEQGALVKETSRGPLGSVDMSGSRYAHTIVLPNVYFHLVTAYDVLRANGVEVGKMDYYQGFLPFQC